MCDAMRSAEGVTLVLQARAVHVLQVACCFSCKHCMAVAHQIPLFCTSQHPNMLYIACLYWCCLQEVITLLLSHHHAAEPQNTARQAQQFHEAAQPMWEACEALQASCAGNAGWPAAAAAAAGGAAGDADEAAAGWQLTDATLGSWSALAEVGWQPLHFEYTTNIARCIGAMSPCVLAAAPS